MCNKGCISIPTCCRCRSTSWPPEAKKSSSHSCAEWSYEGRVESYAFMADGAADSDGEVLPPCEGFSHKMNLRVILPN